MPSPTSHCTILLTEGSSLSARQTLYALGPGGHTIDICDPQPLCLARFSRYVRAWHRCPPFNKDPVGYLEFLADRLSSEHYDVLLPTHDQVFLLARYRDVLGRRVGLAVPAFDALERVQSKAGFVSLLAELGLPHPPTVVAHTRQELEQQGDNPCYVKLAHSTAGCGVWFVPDAVALQRLIDKLEASGLLDGRSEILKQQPAKGVFCVAQAVFQHGRLLGAHCYEARALGIGGSAWARVGSQHPVVVQHLGQLGTHLNWHGALNLEYFYDAALQTPSYIEANPRIGETLNATLSGVNLGELLVKVSVGGAVKPLPPGRSGVRTHNLVMRLLAVARADEKRRSLLAELWRVWTRQGYYAGSQDELTRLREDPFSLIPAAFLCLRLLLNPRAAAAIITRTVANYALSESAARVIRELPGDLSIPGLQVSHKGV